MVAFVISNATISASSKQKKSDDAGIIGPSSIKDIWVDYARTNTFRQTVMTTGVQPIFRSGTTKGQTSASGSCYCDDVELWVEEFHQIPDEVKGTTIIFR